ncbi:MAG: nucleoside triphosphate pyrophosphohydrolase [Coriobacteriia bacterium]|nr:nucleoside triphosphate pyrophosphohydrolase [Coriobacteriia bacterium]
MGSIAIVGVGHEAGAALGEATSERLRRASRVVVPSAQGTVARVLADEGIDAVTLSEIGLAPDMPVEQIIESLVSLAREGDVAFATSGYPFFKEGLLTGLLVRSRGTVNMYPTLSPLQVILMAFDIDLTADLDIIDVDSLRPDIEQRDSHLIVTGLRNRACARQTAERLSTVYPSDHAAVVAEALPGGGFALSMHTVADVADAFVGEDAAVYVAPTHVHPPGGFNELVRLIAVLRGPDGCPWDRAQSHMSLRRHMLEEAYEAVAAIESGDANDLADELGDVLLQVVLHAQIAADDDRFTIDDVIAGISEKIHRRHPHVFGDATAETPDDVHEHWDAIKRDEKSHPGLLGDVPRALPALVRAQKISRRVVGVGFEWETLEDVWEKFHEEIDELKATEPGSPEAADEIGDLLFTLVNIARKQGIDAEEALRGTCDKFSARWRVMEADAAKRGEKMASLGIDELERMWQEAKDGEP